MKLKVQKAVAKIILERTGGSKKNPSKVRRSQDKIATAGKDDTGTAPEATILDVIYEIPSVKISDGNITLPAGKTVKGEENLNRYLGDLGMAFAWHEPEVMPYADQLDLLFYMDDPAALNFADQYQYAAEEKRFMDDQERWGESKIIRIKRSDLTKIVNQVITEERIGGDSLGGIDSAVSSQMDSIQKEREDLAEKMKVAVASQDERAIENIQARLAQLDKASEALTDAQSTLQSSLISTEAIPSDDDPTEYTTVETEGRIRRSELRALIREAEKELSDLKPVGQMSDEELKAKYHPEDTLADAVHHALGPWLRDMGVSGGEADWGVVKDVMDGLRATLTPAEDGSRGPSAEERRLTQNIMAGSFHKRIQDIAMGVLRDRGWIE